MDIIFQNYVLSNSFWGRINKQGTEHYLNNFSNVTSCDLFSGVQKSSCNIFFADHGIEYHTDLVSESNSEFEKLKKQRLLLESKNIPSSANVKNKGLASVIQISYNIDEFNLLYNGLKENYEDAKDIFYFRDKKGVGVFLKNPMMHQVYEYFDGAIKDSSFVSSEELSLSNKFSQFYSTSKQISKEYTTRSILNFLKEESLDDLITKYETGLVRAKSTKENKMNLMREVLKVCKSIHNYFYMGEIEKYYQAKVETEDNKQRQIVLRYMKELAAHDYQKLDKDIITILIDDFFDEISNTTVAKVESRLKEQKDLISENIYDKIKRKVSNSKPNPYFNLYKLIGDDADIKTFIKVNAVKNINRFLSGLINPKTKQLTNDFSIYTNKDITLLRHLSDSNSNKDILLYNVAFEFYLNNLNSEGLVSSHTQIPKELRVLKTNSKEDFYNISFEANSNLVKLESIVKQILKRYGEETQNYFDYSKLRRDIEIISPVKRDKFDILLHEIKTTIDYSVSSIFNREISLEESKALWGLNPSNHDVSLNNKVHLLTLLNFLSIIKAECNLPTYNLWESPVRQQVIQKGTKNPVLKELNNRYLIIKKLNSILKDNLPEEFFKYYTTFYEKKDLNKFIESDVVKRYANINDYLFDFELNEIQNNFTNDNKANQIKRLTQILFLSSFNNSISLEDGTNVNVFANSNSGLLNEMRGLYVPRFANVKNHSNDIELLLNGVHSNYELTNNFSSEDLFSNSFSFSKKNYQNIVVLNLDRTGSKLNKGFLDSSLRSRNRDFIFLSYEIFIKKYLSIIKNGTADIEDLDPRSIGEKTTEQFIKLFDPLVQKIINSFIKPNEKVLDINDLNVAIGCLSMSNPTIAR